MQRVDLSLESGVEERMRSESSDDDDDDELV